MFYGRLRWFIILLCLLVLMILPGCQSGQKVQQNDLSPKDLQQSNGQNLSEGSQPARDKSATYIDETANQIDPQKMQQLKKLDETAEQMVREVMNGDILKARSLINDISDQVLAIEFSGISTVEGIEAFTSAIVQAKELMNAVQSEPARIQIAAAQVRLSTDALVHKHQPLWHEYYNRMRDDTEQLKQAIEKGQNILMAAQQLQQDYAIIRPAVLISYTPDINEKVESLLAFFIQQANRPEARLMETAHELSRTWDALFQKGDMSAYLPFMGEEQPVYWSLVIGSIIITILCFVAWRKYEAQMGIVPVSWSQWIRRDE